MLHCPHRRNKARTDFRHRGIFSRKCYHANASSTAAARDLTNALLNPSSATAIAMKDSELAVLKQLAEIFTYSLVPLPRVATPAAPPGAEILTPMPILLPIVTPDPPPPSVHFAPVSENTNAGAPLPRVAEETQVQVDPTYSDMTPGMPKKGRS
jgi:hypothetical protein